jgi:hypothetical protein
MSFASHKGFVHVPENSVIGVWFGDIIFPNSRDSGIGILVTQKFCGGTR